MRILSTALVAGVLFLLVDRLVARRAAVLATLVLLTLPWTPPHAETAAAGGHAFLHAPFTVAVPGLAYALAPWTGIVPFALVRGRGPGRLVLAVVAVACLGLASVLPDAATPRIVALVPLAAVVGAALHDLDASPPDALLASGVLVIDLLVARDHPGLGWVMACTTFTASLALLVDATWLPFRRSALIAAAAFAGGLLLRVKGL